MSEPSSQAQGHLKTLGIRWGRHSLVYAGGAFITLVLALVQVAIVTRFLNPAEYGRLALLLTLAAFLTILYDLGSLQGTLRRVFGATDDDGDLGGGEEDDQEQETGPPTDRRTLLGIGMVGITLVAAVGTGLIAVASPGIAELITGSSDDADLVVIAALSGGIGALWRISVNIVRFERRPGAFAVLSNVRPLLVLGAMTLLLAMGEGLRGGLVGVVIGSGLSLGIALFVTRGQYRLAFSTMEFGRMFRLGVYLIPVMLGFWVLSNVDLYIVSAYVPQSEVGIYRLASRIGAVGSYFTSAFLMAWIPLRRTAVYAAAERQRGFAFVGGRIVTYFVYGSLGLILALSLSAEALVRIAPGGYADAAPLIPFLAGGFVAHGFVTVIWRTSRFPRRRLVYGSLAVAAAALFIPLALFLTARFGTYGAAISVIVAFTAPALALIFLSQRGSDPLPLRYFRIVAAAALCVACLLAGEAGGGALVKLSAFLAYPIALVVTRLLPPSELRALAGVARGLLPHRTESAEIGEAIMRLDPPSRLVLQELVADRTPLSKASSGSEMSEREAAAVAVRALREIAGVRTSSEHDAEIGVCLFSQMTVAERDRMARRLWKSGVDPGEMHQLESLRDRLRRVPAETWVENPPARAPVHD